MIFTQRVCSWDQSKVLYMGQICTIGSKLQISEPKFSLFLSLRKLNYFTLHFFFLVHLFRERELAGHNCCVTNTREQSFHR